MAKRKSESGRNRLGIVAGVVGLAIVAYVVVWVFRPGDMRTERDACQLLAEERTASIDIDATVQGLELVKGSLGVSGGKVQEVDAVLKDYAFKFAAACRDHQEKRMGDAEYACRRDNMDRTLGAARSLSLTLAEVKAVGDGAAQRDILVRNLDAIMELAKNDFATGCGSALVVTPNTISFGDRFPERTIEVANAGNRSATYTVSELPEAFVAVRGSGPVVDGGTVVSIKRTPFPVPAGDVVFHVKDNFGGRVPVTITVAPASAQLYEDLGAETTKGLKPGQAAPTLADALATVSAQYPTLTDDATKHFVASGILQQVGNFAAAGQALEVVAEKDRALYDSGATQLLQGVVNFKLQRSAAALENFERAAAASGDERGRASSRMFSSGVLLSQGRESEAKQLLADPSVRVAMQQDPGLTRSVERRLEMPTFSNAAREAVR